MNKPVNKSKTAQIKFLNHVAKSGRSILGVFEYLNNSDPKSDNYYRAIEDAYGIKPALFSTYYPFNEELKRFEWEEANERIIKHYNEGAICLVHSQNNRWAEDLVTEDEITDFICNLDETNNDRIMSYYERYLEVRKQWADALEALKKAGVRVIYRPFVEMTNHFHWDCNAKSQKGYAAFKRVWVQLHDYMENERGLDNIIWCFAPQAAGGWKAYVKDSNGNQKEVGAARFYPGDDYVDIIGFTHYSCGNKDGMFSIARELELWDYSEYFKLGKPVGFSELGVKPRINENTGEMTEPGDFANLLQHIKSEFKGKISFCCMWSVEQGLLYEKHLSAKEFVNDDYFIKLTDMVGHTVVKEEN